MRIFSLSWKLVSCISVAAPDIFWKIICDLFGGNYGGWWSHTDNRQTNSGFVMSCSIRSNKNRLIILLFDHRQLRLRIGTNSTDNWVAPPDVKYFKVLVPTMGNIFDQNDEVKRVRTPPFAIHLAVT